MSSKADPQRVVDLLAARIGQLYSELAVQQALIESLTAEAVNSQGDKD